MIPPVIHHVWVGDPMPDHLAAYVATWAEHHPKWGHRLWGEGDLDWLTNQRLYDEAEKHTPAVGQFRSDVARYEILHRHGGVYVDADFECLRPLDELLTGVRCFAAWETDGVWVNNAIMGAEPGHPLFAELIRRLPSNVVRKRGRRPNHLSGPRFLTPVARAYRDVTVFESALFYPYRWDELDRAGEPFPDAYAVHHWDNARKRAAVHA